MADKMEYENLPPGHMATFVEGELGFLPFFPPVCRPSRRGRAQAGGLEGRKLKDESRQSCKSCLTLED